ncbi:mucin-5AC isoform X2 [Sturnira hondurensis]|uniref:mucin-5AC isoform X2 n=1 Tax=Sturnira hondurensis TaxID=192404 RepID=UPI00187A02B9|nr:mucin-5AC isoform X2 [Sturnira hondurensis]
MGVGRREVAALWGLALALACAQHPGDPLLGVTILPPLKTTAVVRALNPAHNGRVCSTWGDFHYKTFDGDVFRFPGLCNYIFSTHCGAAYEDFNVQLRRGQASNATALSKVTMKLGGMVLELTKGSVLVDGRLTQLPFSQSGVLIEHSVNYLKVVARLGLVFMWNQDGSLLLELDPKYANQTCGLCGDFNGVPVFNEFISRGVRLSPIEFGSLQKMDGPTEQCQDPVPSPTPLTGCSNDSGLCQKLLLSEWFLGCRPLVDASRYVQACQQDLCRCGEATNLTSCACHTVAEYSRQCAHAGGLPLDWRGPDLCPQTCPLNMQYRECSSPCADTCSNLEHSQACEDHCVAGCFCPEGMVLDDIGQKGCVPVSQCPCAHNGATYATGAAYSTECSTCTCSGGRWSCREVACPGTCSVVGGAHFSTFDEKPYTVHGDCSYVLAKPCNGSAFTVLAELRRCGLTDSESCLRSLTLSLGGGQTVVTVQAGGEVFVDQVYAQLPISAANITVFRPSTFFVIAQTNLGLQVDVQLVPTMQVFLRLAPELRGLTCGLCGNFNQNQADDFRTLSGVVEGTAASFANTWKTQAACPNVRNSFEDPCALSVENEKYAQHWCSRLTDPQGPFAQCHAAVSPGSYYSHCLFDTCNCERSEDCLCAALSSYVRACAARGVLLSGWRAGVCAKPMENCPQSMTYHHNISTCQPTCRALSNEDPTCGISFVPVDGCTCPQGTFLDDTGKCVPAASCPCYHGALVIPSGESVHQQGAVCTCTKGTLTCIGGHTPDPVCAPPMVYADCRNASAGATGAGCRKSCRTLDMDCYSPQCVPGCVCPDGLVADGEGGCLTAADCPCVHNEASYRAGQTIRVGCNTCTCQSRVWQCTDKPCMATCAVYGDGHYLTFDGQRYSFSGNCEYTLVQDHCGGNSSSQDTFRVVTENVPCGTTGTTCSKAIKIFLGSYELKLSDGKVEVIQKAAGQEAPYAIRQVGIYLVVDTEFGLVLLWDKKTSIFLRLSPEFKGRVCGLCGNFDDNALNDFTTRSQSVVGDALEFGNSWKFSPSCPDAPAPRDPCTANPYRKSWAQKQCSLLNSATFETCHAHVDPTKYYEACVSDACACDSGGDCECFCTAVAAYAQACREAGVCVSWRTPDVCPLFCDYYNPQGECEWHYQPCGAPCLRTCRNPRGQCRHDTQGLEGCYPRCPEEAPIFDEDNMQCVAACPSPPPPPACQVQGKSYRPGAAVPSDKNCYSCICTESGVQCTYDADACVCTYGGRQFRPGDVIYHTTDGTGGCISAHCGANGTIERRVHACSPNTPAPTTTFSFSTPLIATSSTGQPGTLPHPARSPAPTGTLSRAPPTAARTSPRPQPLPASASPHPGCGEDCQWSPWLDVSRPGRGIDSGDFDTLDNLRAHGHPICRAPRAVDCRAEDAPETPLQDLGSRVECTPTVGLACYNRDQVSGLCGNYQIRVLCCTPRACPTSSGPAPTASRTACRTTPGATARQTGGTAQGHTASPSTPANTRRNPAPSTPGTVPVSTTAGKATSGPSAPPRPSEGPGQPTSPQPSQIPCVQEFCSWTAWIDGSYPTASIDGGDFDTFQNLRSKGYEFCERPSQVECRAVSFPNTPLADLGQNVLCNNSVGLVCRNRDQVPPICYNYEVRIQCCAWVDVCTDRTTAEATWATRSTTQEVRTRSKAAPTSGTQGTSTEHRSVSSGHVPQTATVTASTHITYTWTTSCQPRCSWTKWFDVDFPSPGPHGGDLETYSNIVRSGEKICRRPEYISHLQCRAENHPEVSIESVGQVVQCSPDVGLVCRNRDQRGTFKMCLNYEVRVLCCEPREGCPLTSATPGTSSSVTSLLTSEPTSGVPAVTTLSSSAPSTTKCYCSVSHKLYPAGSIIYQEADLAGHCYYAVCSLDCHVVRQTDQVCPTSTVLPTPTPSMPGSSPSAPVPVTTQGCPSAVPPRSRGETWPMPNCSQATCEGNNAITLQPRRCPQLQEPTCANGYPALKVADEDGCCQHYQCQCVCSGWGDPHYITFDGTYYTFLDDCTYVLVQQIVPVYGHFRVLIDNYFCDSEDRLSCPQSIIVEYRQDRVVLARKPVRGVMTNEILFNNNVVRPGFAKDGIVVSQIGIKMYVSIPEVGVQVMFSGLIFSVDVPFSKFANNTEGQCGTCTNNRKDECRLPGGAVVASCSDMSWHWKVTNPDQPTCHGPPPTPPRGGPTTLPTSCPPSPICQLILSDTFKPCHTVIPPRPYYEGCVFDWCHLTEPDVVCSGLELYASLCAARGLCIDWRGRTNHTCPFTCPADKEYRPCGPSNPSYCYGGDSTSLVALKDIGPITEGCFCPENMTLFSMSTEVCVPAGCPRCLGPHGEPVELGGAVTFDCQECTCEGTTWTLSCRRQPCPLPPACPEPGFVSVPVAPQAGQCCPQYTCACNASYCPALSGCPEGSLQTVNYEEGACCPSQKCGWTVCSVNGTLYQPGAVVSSSLCQTCRCEVPGGPQADAFRISCETETCSTHCPMGFEYQAQSGRCCGSCVQVACVMNTSDGSTHLFHPGESWPDSGNRCVTHQCEKHGDGLVVVTVKKTCPSLTCPADQTKLSKDGCCLSCSVPQTQNKSACVIYHKLEVIRVQGCSSEGPVSLAYCKGNCGDTTSVFSLEAGELEHNCSCCRELRAAPRNVTLRCADGSRRAFSYTQVEECGCAGLQCDTRSGLRQDRVEGPLRSQEAARRRWSRRARAIPAA